MLVLIVIFYLFFLIGHTMKLAFNIYLIVESFQGFDVYPYVGH